jgi:4-hydroxyacetophenone monooxygenase
MSLVDKYSLRAHTHLNAELALADWDDVAKLYRLQLKDVQSGEVRNVEARVVISAVGGLVVPRYPDIKGMCTFEGPSWHSGKWNHNISLPGKKVGVFGNGCSASVDWTRDVF